jgi:hypothetical protein
METIQLANYPTELPRGKFITGLEKKLIVKVYKGVLLNNTSKK